MVLQVNFIMTCIIHKILVLLKTTIILKQVLRSIINFYSLKDNYFSQLILQKQKKKKKLILQLKYKKSR